VCVCVCVFRCRQLADDVAGCFSLTFATDCFLPSPNNITQTLCFVCAVPISPNVNVPTKSKPPPKKKKEVEMNRLFLCFFKKHLKLKISKIDMGSSFCSL